MNTWNMFIDGTKTREQEPLPLSSRSDRVCAPDLDLAGSDSNSLLNLGWNRGMHRKSNLQTQKHRTLLTLQRLAVERASTFGTEQAGSRVVVMGHVLVIYQLGVVFWGGGGAADRRFRRLAHITQHWLRF